MNPVFDVLQWVFQRVAEGAQRVALASARKCATLCDVLRSTSFSQRVALKVVSTEPLSKRCNTATLLLLKNFHNIHVYVYAHMYVYIGENKERGFELLRPRAVGVSA
jgi:hypothetical protein